MPPAPAPRAEYERRRDARRATAAAEERRDARIANLRLLVFGAAVAAAVAAWRHALHPAWIAAPVVGYVALAVWHDRVLKRAARARAAVAHYERGLRRIADEWAGTGVQRTDLAGADHAYAADLDLFGPGSLFELLCGARTSAGQATLGRWLLAPAPLAAVRERQRAVDELRPRLDLREDVALLAGEVQATVDPAALTAWSAGPAPLAPGPARAAQLTALVLSVAAVTFIALWSVFPPGRWLVAVALVLQGALLRLLSARLARVTGPVERAERELAVLARLLARLERETFTAPRLVELERALRAQGMSAAEAVRRLGRLAEWHAAQQNQLFAPVAFALAWNLHFGLALDRWRRRHGPAVGRWLEAVGEVEALADLAAYAYEHPADPFPELDEGGPLFEGEELGHPLLPAARCVRNSVRLGPDQRVLIISGSNMSGKSTLLRTVGVNVVLALAGAPVRAARLRLSALRAGATLQIHDSIREGRSRFYAEIRRLRDLVEIARGERGTLLFLLDEILHGTNSHDRRVGAEAVIRSFVTAGGIGLATTHDLALTEVVAALDGHAGNAHFADEVVDGELRFDYRLRPGVVERSNALALMRSVGLEV